MKGIDIAKWNKVTNYKSVKEAGVEFAIVKVINASNKPDDRLHEHVTGCNSVGIPVDAGYTYSYANTRDKARNASAAFVEVGAPKGIKKMVLDLEDKAMMGLGREIVPIIYIYKEAAKAAGMDFLIYTGAQYYNPCLKPYAKEIAGIPIWWARYPFIKDYSITADVPDSKYLPTGMELAGWQYSSKGVIPGIQGYTDLNTWYHNEKFENVKKEIPIEYNPFTEPETNVSVGKTGNDVMWVQWYLWRFGKLTNSMGQADAEQINGIFDANTAQKVKEVQALLGLAADGIVGKVTRSLWKKIC